MAVFKTTVEDSVKKPYEKPEIEVIELDNQVPFLAASGYQSNWVDYEEENI